jgi:hypothetical protein
MSTTAATSTIPARTAGRRAGYLVAIVVNCLFLWLANHLLEWGWPRFLTEDFGQVLPYVNASLLITLAVNLLWLAFDPPWFKSFAQIGINLVAILVGIKFYEVFPFDFTGYAPIWENLARVVIALTIVGSGIGALVETVRFLRYAFSADAVDAV